ncbi:MAG: hypothetical protein ACR2QQ_08725 [Gammaproteobacteria bacterium]
MSAKTDIALEDLASYTDAVATAISEGDWQHASELEAERRSLLERYIATEREAHGGIEHLRDKLADLIDLSNRALGEVHHHRRQILLEAAALQRGREATEAYAHTSASTRSE